MVENMTNSEVKAYLLAIVKRGSEHKVATEIEKYEEVSEVLITYGMLDLVIRLEAEDLKRLDAIVTKIRQMPDIEQTHTLIGF